MQTIDWEDFSKVELRVGKIIEVKDFPEARNPSYKVKVDFGDKIGIKKSSAQITDLYTKDDLMNRLIIGVVNFSPKQIGPFMSECLITGFHTEGKKVVLAMPENAVPLGSKLL